MTRRRQNSPVRTLLELLASVLCITAGIVLYQIVKHYWGTNGVILLVTVAVAAVVIDVVRRRD